MYRATAGRTAGIGILTTGLCLLALTGCERQSPVALELDPAGTPPSYSGDQSVSSRFELIGGYRLDVEFASEGLGVVRDADGYVVEAIVGAHAQRRQLALFDLRLAPGEGADAERYPLLGTAALWNERDLFPGLLEGQNVRDVTVARSASGYELFALGRTFYQTAPRGRTVLGVRRMQGANSLRGAVIGAGRDVVVPLPEQQFSGFVKDAEGLRDTLVIGGGAYESGQGSVGGISYAERTTSGVWTRRLNPPDFGDLSSPRLPRDAEYSCPGGLSWVCLPPIGNVGVWSTEFIGGGGVRYGDNVLFIAMLGYGPRSYAQQSLTFSVPGQPRAVAYFFRLSSGGEVVEFNRFDQWVHAEAGERVIGVALGRLRSESDLILFVVKGYAWQSGTNYAGSVLQLFRVKSNRDGGDGSS